MNCRRKFLICLLSITCISACSEKADTALTINTPQEGSRVLVEDFEAFPFTEIPRWEADSATYQGPYSESGEYYQQKGILPPKANRTTVGFGVDDWLTAEIYTRVEKNIVLLDYLDVVADPDNPDNQVLKIATPLHTDGVVLRSREPLPANYKISLKIGHAHYGDDTALNGYNDGNESAEPWRKRSAVRANGFYWLAILDSAPRPHNNIWIHHHRKFVIDSWNRAGFNNTVNIFALDGKSDTHEAFGKKFISYVGGRWQHLSDVPVDFYLPDEWYRVTFERTDSYYEFTVSGLFKNAGDTTFSVRIDFAQNCVYHYNQTAAELHPSCIDNRWQTFMKKDFVYWPKDSAYPDYFMLGEPHINYYEGSVLVDDIKLETY